MRVFSKLLIPEASSRPATLNRRSKMPRLRALQGESISQSHQPTQLHRSDAIKRRRIRARAPCHIHICLPRVNAYLSCKMLESCELSRSDSSRTSSRQQYQCPANAAHPSTGAATVLRKPLRLAPPSAQGGQTPWPMAPLISKWNIRAVAEMKHTAVTQLERADPRERVPSTSVTGRGMKALRRQRNQSPRRPAPPSSGP